MSDIRKIERGGRIERKPLALVYTPFPLYPYLRCSQPFATRDRVFPMGATRRLLRNPTIGEMVIFFFKISPFSPHRPSCP